MAMRIPYYCPIENVVVLYKDEEAILCPLLRSYREHGIPLGNGITMDATPLNLEARFRLDIGEFGRKTAHAIERGLERMIARNHQAGVKPVPYELIPPLCFGKISNIHYALSVLERESEAQANAYWDDLVELHVQVHPTTLPLSDTLKAAKHVALLSLPERGVILVDDNRHYVARSIPLSVIRAIYTNPRNVAGIKHVLTGFNPSPEVLSKDCLKPQP
ncbi:hypothetical protein HY492_02405 [Candidatus Woesearchaeota archaeon]|nr:hypothetical protein [Candidatus Woesearchaeota archaeon]